MTDYSHSLRSCHGVVCGAVLPVVLLMLPTPAVGQHEGDPLSAVLSIQRAFVDVIERTEGSVVSIARVRYDPSAAGRARLEPFGGGLGDFDRDLRNPISPDFVPNEFGTGVIIAPFADRPDRFVLTNYHVVRGGPPAGDVSETGDVRLFVRMADRRGYYAGIFAADPRSDLALLTVDAAALPEELAESKPIPLGDASDVKKGEFVLVLGNPYALARDGSASASWGIVSNISRRPAPAGPTNEAETYRRETIHHFGTLLQLDTRMNLGTSGGALLNLKGKLIGVTTSLAALEGYEKSVGYAIPLSRPIRRIIDTLARGFEVEYGFLGVRPRDVLPEQMQQLSGRFEQTSAAMVQTVFPASPADLGGLRPNDLILKVDGAPVRDRYELMKRVGELGPGVETRLTVWREAGKRELTLVVKLGKWPVYDDEGIIASRSRYPAWRGLSVDYPTGREKYLQYPIQYRLAVVVTNVDAQSAAALTEVEPGDFVSHVLVEGKEIPVRTPVDFYTAIEGRTENITLRLTDGRQVVVQGTP
jgi:serine protease Do